MTDTQEARNGQEKTIVQAAGNVVEDSILVSLQRTSLLTAVTLTQLITGEDRDSVGPKETG
jgi:hypothetical protein